MGVSVGEGEVDAAVDAVGGGVEGVLLPVVVEGLERGWGCDGSGLGVGRDGAGPAEEVDEDHALIAECSACVAEVVDQVGAGVVFADAEVEDRGDVDFGAAEFEDVGGDDVEVVGVVV